MSRRHSLAIRYLARVSFIDAATYGVNMEAMLRAILETRNLGAHTNLVAISRLLQPHGARAAGAVRRRSQLARSKVGDGSCSMRHE